MNKFDKLKLIADISAIRIVDESVFEKNVIGNEISSMRFHQEKPYSLSIKIDYEEREAVVEFTGKVLGEDYPKLISEETIVKCFENINAMGFCEIDIESMMDAEVSKCDVTKDIRYDDIPKLTSYIRSHISNYNSFICRLKRNNNLVLEKNVDTNKCKKRMTIYDKGREMSSAENRRFVADNHLEGVFDGVCRFEMNLTSKKQIRESLGIHNTKLRSVLASTATPISDFVEVAVTQNTNEPDLSDKKEYIAMLVLKDCDYDLEKVEAKMRGFHKRGTKISEVMKPFRAMLEQMQNSDSQISLSELLEMLKS